MSTKRKQAMKFGAPLTNEESLHLKGIEFVKSKGRIMECCKCHKSSGTLVKVGENEYRHQGCN
jgi:hypothetical protein